MKTNVVTIHSLESNLKRKVRRHLRQIGFKKQNDGSLTIDEDGKDAVRALHAAQRKERLTKNRELLSDRAPKLIEHFASGKDIRPKAISPRLERIYAGTQQSELFRLASLTWSVPVSNGFGRRLRYLVWDDSNDKLIGLIAIGDPVFNLAVRDNLIGWTAKDRSARLVNVMDAYVLGALPPYSQLLAGKMIACLIRTREFYEDFEAQYGDTTGVISRANKQARLIAVTTSSSMGRSSVYNRLKLGGTRYFESLGFTEGWGHFHIPDKLFSELRSYLRRKEHPYADLHRFGEGPNWRLRTTRAALKELGLKDNLLRHGIRREVFISFLASEGAKLLLTGQGKPDTTNLRNVDEVAELALERWIRPRAKRDPTYLEWTHEDLASMFGRHGRKIKARLQLAS